MKLKQDPEQDTEGGDTQKEGEQKTSGGSAQYQDTHGNAAMQERVARRQADEAQDGEPDRPSAAAGQQDGSGGRWTRAALVESASAALDRARSALRTRPDPAAARGDIELGLGNDYFGAMPRESRHRKEIWEAAVDALVRLVFEFPIEGMAGEAHEALNFLRLGLAPTDEDIAGIYVKASLRLSGQEEAGRALENQFDDAFYRPILPEAKRKAAFDAVKRAASEGRLRPALLASLQRIAKDGRQEERLLAIEALAATPGPADGVRELLAALTSGQEQPDPIRRRALAALVDLRRSLPTALLDIFVDAVVGKARYSGSHYADLGTVGQAMNALVERTADLTDAQIQRLFEVREEMGGYFASRIIKVVMGRPTATGLLWVMEEPEKLAEAYPEAVKALTQRAATLGPDEVLRLLAVAHGRGRTATDARAIYALWRRARDAEAQEGGSDATLKVSAPRALRVTPDGRVVSGDDAGAVDLSALRGRFERDIKVLDPEVAELRVWDEAGGEGTKGAAAPSDDLRCSLDWEPLPLQRTGERARPAFVAQIATIGRLARTRPGAVELRVWDARDPRRTVTHKIPVVYVEGTAEGASDAAPGVGASRADVREQVKRTYLRRLIDKYSGDRAVPEEEKLGKALAGMSRDQLLDVNKTVREELVDWFNRAYPTGGFRGRGPRSGPGPGGEDVSAYMQGMQVAFLKGLALWVSAQLAQSSGASDTTRKYSKDFDAMVGALRKINSLIGMIPVKQVELASFVIDVGLNLIQAVGHEIIDRAVYENVIKSGNRGTRLARQSVGLFHDSLAKLHDALAAALAGGGKVLAMGDRKAVEAYVRDALSQLVANRDMAMAGFWGSATAAWELSAYDSPTKGHDHATYLPLGHGTLREVQRMPKDVVVARRYTTDAELRGMSRPNPDLAERDVLVGGSVKRRWWNRKAGRVAHSDEVWGSQELLRSRHLKVRTSEGKEGIVELHSRLSGEDVDGLVADVQGAAAPARDREARSTGGQPSEVIAWRILELLKDATEFGAPSK